MKDRGLLRADVVMDRLDLEALHLQRNFRVAVAICEVQGNVRIYHDHARAAFGVVLDHEQLRLRHLYLDSYDAVRGFPRHRFLLPASKIGNDFFRQRREKEILITILAF